jgi:hypothetical protein
VHLSPEDGKKRIGEIHSRIFNRDGRAERAVASIRFTRAALIREATFALDCSCPSGRVEVADAQIKIVLAGDKSSGLLFTLFFYTGEVF